MKRYNFKIVLVAIFASFALIQCVDDDDNGNVIGSVTCDDGIQNGDEEGVDCGGPDCVPCVSGLDFSGTFVQEDVMGRPGINTVFGSTGNFKDLFNIRAVSERDENPDFQLIFEGQLEAYHDVYGDALEIELDYETNILNLDAPMFTTVLAYFDALQVAPDAPTTYFDGTNVLTGRTLSDDVIDISLTLIFGGMDGNRFDGTNGTPQLTTDGVGPGNRDFTLPFPYLEPPLQE